MSIRYSGYTFYSEKEVREREADAYERGSAAGYQLGALACAAPRQKKKVKVRKKRRSRIESGA